MPNAGQLRIPAHSKPGRESGPNSKRGHVRAEDPVDRSHVACAEVLREVPEALQGGAEAV